MKLVSLNIECNKHYDRFLPFLEKENPDVICLQEVLEEDFEFLKEKLGRPGIFKPQSLIFSPHPNYVELQGKCYGVAIFAHEILESGYVYYWGEETHTKTDFGVYLQNLEALRSYVLVWAKVKNASGDICRIASTHYPITKEGASTPHQLEVLIPFFEKLDTLGDFVLCGDFNAPRGNETFRRIAERYTDAIPEIYETSLDQNLHRVKGLMFMVDCLFITQEYEARDVALVDGLSDHMAIVAMVEKR
jgi:endonuclease/exonuclease/phosphatase family metal-dependent hydrolase